MDSIWVGQAKLDYVISLFLLVGRFKFFFFVDKVDRVKLSIAVWFSFLKLQTKPRILEEK
jgi:hypothetical protein